MDSAEDDLTLCTLWTLNFKTKKFDILIWGEKQIKTTKQTKIRSRKNSH